MPTMVSSYYLTIWIGNNLNKSRGNRNVMTVVAKWIVGCNYKRRFEPL